MPHNAEKDAPCPAVLRCPDRRFCPLVCQEAGSREDPNHRPSGYVTPKDALIEQACEVMHDAYEAAALTAGWETQQQSRKPWADVPEANRATMRVAVAALLDWLDTRPFPPAADQEEGA